MRRVVRCAHRWARSVGDLEVVVELTRCIVRDGSSTTTLVVPANETLVGTALPYFPRGGPCPPPLPEDLQGSANSWGALETGPNFVFPAQAVDGVVHRLAGSSLRDLCAAIPAGADGVRCAVGSAVKTGPGALPHYGAVVHAVPPFWDDRNRDLWAAALRDTYAAAFLAADSGASSLARCIDVSTPLVGAGARGAPLSEAAAVAADAILDAAEANHRGRVRFGLTSPDAVDALTAALHGRLASRAREPDPTRVVEDA